MNKTIIWIIIILILAGGAYFLFTDIGKQGNEQTAVKSTEKASSYSLTDKSETTAVKEISMVSGGFFFSPNKLTLKKGQPVKINIKNSGVHTFTIDELGVDVPLTGQSTVVEFTPTKSGTFEYYCAIPGHRENGQFGSVIVL